MSNPSNHEKLGASDELEVSMARNQVMSPSSIQITTYLLVIFAYSHKRISKL